MEEIVLNFDQHKILKKFQRKLEDYFCVKICIPEVSNGSFSDVIVASVTGKTQSINLVKVFLKRQIHKLARRRKKQCNEDGTFPVITISDSDSDSTVEVSENVKRQRMPNQTSHDTDFNSKSVKIKNENTSDVSSATFKPVFHAECSSSGAVADAIDIPNDLPSSSAIEMDDSIVILSEDSPMTENLLVMGVPQDFSKDRNSQVSDDCIIMTDVNPVSKAHASQNDIVKKCLRSNNTQSTSEEKADVCPPALPEYIPLRSSKNEKRRPQFNRNGNIALSDEVSVPRPIMRRILRPVVIDGSNVARSHGQIRNCFSCKGIKLSIEHFLKRGHTHVTALVPQFRRHCWSGPNPTIDHDILEELARSQKVVFTPSRRLNGKQIVCHDDRFIVKLAFKTDGVILSNDNYRDIVAESPQYRKMIEERLLMYCFVGDIIMIPDDPLGRYGPKLDTFLSMEEKVTELPSNSLQVQNSIWEKEKFPE